MKRAVFSLARKDPALVALIQKTDQKTLAAWAIACALRALPFFETAFPHDPRPRKALDTLQAWIDTGRFQMAVIRRASLDAHAAARDVGEDTPARSAARAAGQAVATAHVRTHAIGAAMYGLQAIFRATDPADAEAAIAKERAWQYQDLQERHLQQSPQ